MPGTIRQEQAIEAVVSVSAFLITLLGAVAIVMLFLAGTYVTTSAGSARAMERAKTCAWHSMLAVSLAMATFLVRMLLVYSLEQSGREGSIRLGDLIGDPIVRTVAGGFVALLGLIALVMIVRAAVAARRRASRERTAFGLPFEEARSPISSLLRR